MKRLSVNTFRWIVVASFLLLATGLASAQSVDAMFGVNTLITATPAPGYPKLGGGGYPEFAANIIFFHGFGIGGQVAWRAAQADYFGTGVRPIYYDFNAVWEPIATGRIRPDALLGFGAQSLRAYEGVLNCGTFTGCTDYVSSNHFVLHAGVGARVYFTDHLFLRPAIDFYNIRHNYEYAVPAAWQVGMSIGYTLGPST